ncbi:differentially expressed in FDCP 8 homolog isoform X2 [Nasonia vitripennis]|uniref:Phorbol-ester/DAG-type domain-containing protein n=1 Tax=Nasonia vitripennis TaxID=7425 RepID=A0A7M7TDE7_NASVI|nr:differentially expressed in FDCP 8 homolog isoform X2 [Nasonia vitripennis]XP_032455381.1 differentially expressed in FDCP 8 homolog isoform X2 [Nasonia vitripennis]XP_032455382.1 differentially expressed in FDCP 8 homolog isoform X2 [Nasonia vitripennis]
MNTSVESIDCFETQSRNNNADTAPSTPSSSSDYITGEADDSSDSRGPIPCTLKSVENLLSVTKAMGEDDLQELINKCKQMVLESAECSEERKWLVRRLIELRLRAQEIRETSNANVLETCVILGHHFSPQKYYISTSGSVYCDHCSGGIWTMLQSWYMCNDCGFCCHLKCMTSICRVCVHVVASEAGGYTYTKDICPERGLSAQAYRCAECNTRITFKSGWIEPRLCDYTGLYYCQRCHWNSVAVIPARIIRNWDMEPRKVSRAAYQLLTLLQNKPVLMLDKLNQKLFSFIPDLSLIKRLREELQMMKQYLVICPEASTQGLPWKSGLRTHMLESSGNYSVKDLVDLENGILVDEIQIAYNAMKTHITETCRLCKARGHHCEICGNDEIIYPWDTTATMCQLCSTVYHRLCRSKRNHCCPKCLRIQQRQSTDIGAAITKNDNTDNCDSTA